jgi:hypothetical protein
MIATPRPLAQHFAHCDFHTLRLVFGVAQQKLKAALHCGQFEPADDVGEKGICDF